MRKPIRFIYVMVLLFIFGMIARAQVETVQRIFQRHCTSCHGGPRPPQELNLEPGVFFANTVNVESMQRPNTKLVEPGRPGASYLLLKITGKPGIVGKQMPLKREPLRGKALAAVREWIANLDEDKIAAYRPPRKKREQAFWGGRLINLATPGTVPRGTFIFRVSHRFVPSVKDGYQAFYGLNGPSLPYVSLGYGISTDVMVTLGHAAQYHQWEGTIKWRFLSPAADSSFPLSAAFYLGGGVVTNEVDSGEFKGSVRLSLAYPLGSRVSVLLVPGYSTNVAHYDPDGEGTFALGTGFRVKLGRHLAVIAECIPVLSGFKEDYAAWGIGLEYRIGKHLFQLFALNSVGLTMDQYWHGSSMSIKDGDFRLGFNIFREF